MIFVAAVTQAATIGEYGAEGVYDANGDSGGDSAQQPQAPEFQIGGALRFNYAIERYDSEQRKRGGDVSLDLFRLNISGEEQGIDFSAEYRWFSYQDVLHHGWAGFKVGDSAQLRVGVSQVPFGILPYAAHNYWFGIPFYVGLGDAYKFGGQYIRASGPWDLRMAFFKNPTQNDPSNNQRYGYDVVNHSECAEDDDPPDDDPPICSRESNQINLRLAYTLGKGSACPAELGASGQWGQLPNDDTQQTGSRWAAAGHLDVRCGRWNFQLQAARQVIDLDLDSTPAQGEGKSATFGGMAGTHQVASEASLGVVNVAYNFPVPWEHIDSLTCYNDFSVYLKDEPGFSNSQINTSGCAIGRGPLFIYADLVRGKNAPFVGEGEGEEYEPLGEGGAGWETRYNLNLGYYF